MTYIPKDHYFKKAKKEKYNARSVYKLQELDSKFRIIRYGQQILEFGTGLGSWMQYYSPLIGQNGRALTIDIKPIDANILNKGDYRNVVFENSSVFSDDISDIILANGFDKFDVVLSDLSPAISGIKDQDNVRSFELCLRVLKVSKMFLKNNSTLVCKMFESEYRQEFESVLKKCFTYTNIFRPKSVRHQSREMFFVAKQLKTESAYD